jgi:hypothetical protein
MLTLTTPPHGAPVAAPPYWDRHGFRVPAASPAARFLRAAVEAAYPVDPDEAELLLDSAAELADCAPPLALARLFRRVSLAPVATPAEGVAAQLAVEALGRRAGWPDADALRVRLTRRDLAARVEWEGRA